MDDIGTVSIICKWDANLGRRANRIEFAAPRIRFEPALLDSVSDDGHADRDVLHLDGDVLTIRDDYGQRFIYRIHWDDYRDGGYLAEWPD